MDDPLKLSKKAQLKNAKKIIDSAEHHIKEWEIAGINR